MLSYHAAARCQSAVGRMEESLCEPGALVSTVIGVTGDWRVLSVDVVSVLNSIVIQPCACGLIFLVTPLCPCLLFVGVCYGCYTVVGSIWGGEARQTHTLVGTNCVDALCVPTQGHLVVELWALIHICQRHHRSIQSGLWFTSSLFQECVVLSPTQAMWARSRVNPSKQSQV